MNTEAEKTIVEINGIKLEVDLRTAKKVDEYKVGDMVKVLKKEYSDSYTSYPGMIVGFDAFVALPTIIVAYLESKYGSYKIEFVYLNAKTEEIEICHTDSLDMAVDKATVITMMDEEITKKSEEIKDLQRKKDYFTANFNRYFEETTA